MGLRPEEIEHEIRDMDWDDVLKNQPPRPERQFRRKRDDDNYLDMNAAHLIPREKPGRPAQEILGPVRRPRPRIDETVALQFVEKGSRFTLFGQMAAPGRP